MLIVCGLEKDDSGVDGPGAERDDVCFVGGGCRAVHMLDFHGCDGASASVGEKAKDARVREERDVGEIHDLADAVDVGVGLGVYEARIAVAGVAANALAGDRVERVALEAQGNGEGIYAELAHVGFDLGHAGFAGEGGIGIALGVEGLGWVEGAGKAPGNVGFGAEVAVDVKEFLGAGVVRLHVGVGDGPGGGDASLMLDDAEVFGTHAKHGGAVDFGLSSNVIGLLWVKGLIVFVVPRFSGVVAVLKEYSRGIPVELFLGKKRAALEDEDTLARACEMESKGSAASAGANDDCVVGIRHEN